MSKFLEDWNEFKVLVESLDLDVHKSLSGNKSAGVRARKGLRLAKKRAAELVRLSLEDRS
jgi:hypothetical protein|tara:strand:- start:745 stop:924 length:180 start_codon:yes stop_codon:yes gene_type:complete